MDSHSSWLDVILEVFVGIVAITFILFVPVIVGKYTIGVTNPPTYCIGYWMVGFVVVVLLVFLIIIAGLFGGWVLDSLGIRN